MPKPQKLSTKRFSAATAGLVSVLVFLAGCSAALSVPGEKMPPTEIDVSELTPGSVSMPVLAYKWNYFNGTSHVRVTGTVINATGAPVHGARLQGILYDQDGTPIAYGDSFVTPSYVPANGKGTFDFSGLVKRESGVTHTRLVVTVRTSSY
ncbi:MAG: FxLYD domain-containing protein [Deltaproteobacteria bacterium]|jgi:hypothetical protein|nr:FxLYD domain-containing protein [Deltaproteobacteria bacterium]